MIGSHLCKYVTEGVKTLGGIAIKLDISQVRNVHVSE